MDIRDELKFLRVVLNITQDIFLILFFPALSHTLSYENHMFWRKQVILCFQAHVGFSVYSFT